MKIKQFTLRNIGQFENVNVALAPIAEGDSNITVLVGNNGAGKTSLLKSLATSLSWLVARIRTEAGSGSPIPVDVISNSSISAAVDIQVSDENAISEWRIARTKKARKGEFASQLSGVTTLADTYRQKFAKNEQAALPLIAFYSVERVVLDIPLKIRDKHSFLQVDGYANSLAQGVDFRRFFEWFRDREDAENESGLSQEVFDKLAELFGKDDGKLWEQLSAFKASARDRQLVAVRTAISNFMPGFTNLRVRRKPRLHMSIDKNGETLSVTQLSQGEKSLMALVGDIARRLAMMNPALENPLHGEGIVLIDEVDMHLHPLWQRTLVECFTKTFPSCQFVFSTHSPLVISDCKDVLAYSLNNGELRRLPSLYGLDVNSVLLEVMDTDIRNAEVNKSIGNLYDAIHAGKITLAQSLIESLAEELPAGNIDLIKANFLIKKLLLRHA